MYGLPNQSREQWMRDAAQRHRPQGRPHLLLRPEGRGRDEALDLQGLRESSRTTTRRRTCTSTPSQTLEQFGYHQYEISNFAHDGFICRHNMKYWVGRRISGLRPVRGVGLCGQAGSPSRPNLEKYIEGVMDEGRHPVRVRSTIPLRERAGEYLMLRLRTVDGIEEGEYTSSFLLPFEPHRRRSSSACRRRSYAAFSAGRWHLTPKGFMLSNSILVDAAGGAAEVAAADAEEVMGQLCCAFSGFRAQDSGNAGNVQKTIDKRQTYRL